MTMIKPALLKRISDFMFERRNGNLYLNQKEVQQVLDHIAYYQKLATEKEMLVCALGKEKAGYTKEAEGAWKAVSEMKSELQRKDESLELAVKTLQKLEKESDLSADRIGVLNRQIQALLAKQQTTVVYQFRSVNATGTKWGMWKEVSKESYESIKLLNKKQGGAAHQFRELVEKTYVE